jgi:hypothetical protein
LGYHWAIKEKRRKKRKGRVPGKEKCQASLFQKPHYLSKHMATFGSLSFSLEF